MMEYQVPQFIEVEDKIFGPFTFKQFVYLAGGAGLCAIFFIYLPLLIAILLSLPVAGLAGALAFYRVNNKPFEEILEAGLMYISGGRLYLWRKESKPTKAAAPKPAPNEDLRSKMRLSRGKLQDLAWSLDIKDQPRSPL
jgi:hypothetical protein